MPLVAFGSWMHSVRDLHWNQCFLLVLPLFFPVAFLVKLIFLLLAINGPIYGRVWAGSFVAFKSYLNAFFFLELEEVLNSIIRTRVIAQCWGWTTKYICYQCEIFCGLSGLLKCKLWNLYSGTCCSYYKDKTTALDSKCMLSSCYKAGSINLIFCSHNKKARGQK